MQLLDQAYGIGKGLKAPQATLVKSVVEMMFDPSKGIPWTMLTTGAGIGIAILVMNKVAVAMGKKLGISVMAVAVGIYLPISLSTPLIIGALIRHFYGESKGLEEGSSDSGILFGSGLIAGEALMAIILAIPMILSEGAWGGWESGYSSVAMYVATGVAIAMVADSLRRAAQKKN